MKIVVALISVVLSLCARPATAWEIGPNAGPNTYGIYFEVDGEFTNMIGDIQPNSFVPTFVILSGVTRPSIGGWEVAFEYTPGTGAVITTEYLGSATNLATAPDFIVSLSTPIASVAGCYLVLAEMNTLFFAGYMDWYAGPTDPASIPLSPSYTNGEDPTDLVRCFFSTDHKGIYTGDDGWMTIPVASINYIYQLRAEASSWSDLKRMYR